MSFDAIFQFDHAEHFMKIKTNSLKIEPKMDSIVSEIIDEIIEKSCNTVGTPSNDVSAEESAESRFHSCTVINDMITEILELAHNNRTVNEFLKPLDERKNDEKIDQNHSSTNVVSDSNVGIIVDNINPCNNNSTDPLVENEPNKSIKTHKSDESFIVDHIEICKNESLPSAAVISDEPSAIEQVKEVQQLDQATINVSPKIDFDQLAGMAQENVKREGDLDVEQLGQTTIIISPKMVSHQPAGMAQENVKHEEDVDVLPPGQTTINVSPKIVSNQSGDANQENLKREGDFDMQQPVHTTVNVSPKIVSHQPAGMTQVNVKREEDGDVLPHCQATINVSPKIVSNRSGEAKEKIKREGDFDMQQPVHTTVNVSKKIVSDQPATTNQKNEKGKGNFSKGKPVRMTESTNFVSLKEIDQFYSIEELHRRGYFTRFSGTVKYITNLSLPSDLVGGVKVQCRGFPLDMTEYRLIPMLERCGRILELKFENDVVDVTFTTYQEARNASGKFNGKVFQGQPVKVEVLTMTSQLYVSGIPANATNSVLSRYFNKLTKGFDKLCLLNSQVDQTKNRGYCHLTYIDHKSALDAKEIILKTVYGGRRLYADWAEPKHSKDGTYLTPPPYKLYMNNLRPGLTTSDLRKLFSQFGSVLEVDKNGNWASVKFRHPLETKQAFAHVDRKYLGDDKVELSLNELQE